MIVILSVVCGVLAAPGGDVDSNNNLEVKEEPTPEASSDEPKKTPIKTFKRIPSNDFMSKMKAFQVNDHVKDDSSSNSPSGSNSFRRQNSATKGSLKSPSMKRHDLLNSLVGKLTSGGLDLSSEIKQESVSENRFRRFDSLEDVKLKAVDPTKDPVTVDPNPNPKLSRSGSSNRGKKVIVKADSFNKVSDGNQVQKLLSKTGNLDRLLKQDKRRRIQSQVVASTIAKLNMN